MKLLIAAIVKFIFGAVITGFLLFCSAGTVAWAGGWIFMVSLFLPMFLGSLFKI